MSDFTQNFRLKINNHLINRIIGQNNCCRKGAVSNESFGDFRTKCIKAIIVLFLVFGLATVQSFGQRDQITTQAGEKIRCRILDETPSRFVFAYLSPTGKVLRNEIFKNLVSDFKYNFYSNDIVTKGNKMPVGLGGARDENAAETQRIDTRKSESAKNDDSKKSGKKSKTKKASEEEKAVKSNAKKTVEVSEKESENAEKQLDENTKEIVKDSKEDKSSRLPEKKVSEKKSSTDKKAAEKAKKEEVSDKKEAKKPKEEKAVMPLSTKKTDNEFNNYLKWRVGGKAGFGKMLAKVPTEDAYSLYQEKLLRGFTWGADVSYFFTDHIGAGLMFNNFQSNNKAENIAYRNEILNKTETGNISNKRSIKFVGPVLYYRKNIDFKTMVILGLSPGAYFYKDKGTYGNAGYTFTGMDFGGSATLGVDFLLGNDITGRDIILSLEGGYSYGKMRAVDFGTGGRAVNLATPIDLSRLDITVGLRFTRYPKYFKLTSY